jgi:hypothetical protein
LLSAYQRLRAGESLLSTIYRAFSLTGSWASPAKLYRTTYVSLFN